MTAKLDLSPRDPTACALGHGGGRNGRVTSCVFSPHLGKRIGYATLALPWTNLGTDLTVESPDAERAATIVEKTCVDPKKTLARAF
jgi:glycine cleavage system aminomethyltransferase T